jgi:hypothetical protein
MKILNFVVNIILVWQKKIKKQNLQQQKIKLERKRIYLCKLFLFKLKKSCESIIYLFILTYIFLVR